MNKSPSPTTSKDSDNNPRIFKSLHRVPAPNHNERGNGWSLESLDQLRRQSSEFQGLEKRWWNRLEPNLQRYMSLTGREGWFAVAPFREILSQDELEATYHAGLYQSVPGLLTGLGLLGTFTALLIGLLDLKYTPTEITGLPILINNLSGKFLSSVIALILGLVFLVVEKMSIFPNICPVLLKIPILPTPSSCTLCAICLGSFASSFYCALFQVDAAWPGLGRAFRTAPVSRQT